MKLTNLNETVQEILNKKPIQQKQPIQLEDMLSTMLGVLQRFEKHGKINKANKEKIDILKDYVTCYIKDEEQKKLINGGQ